MEEAKKETVAQRLKELRRSCGLTQQDVADRLAIHRTTYTKYETDKVTPSLECMESLCRLFDVPLNVMLGVEAAGTVGDKTGEASTALSADEQVLLTAFRALTPEQRHEAIQRMLHTTEGK